MNLKRATLLLAVLAVITTAAVVWQRISLSHATQQLQAAPAVNSVSNVSSASTISEIGPEAAALREQTRELPKLRNEIGPLRAKLSELAAARVENERLLDAKRTGAPLPREVPPGFISKEQLHNAGYETPEDAIQTFFWAIRDGNPAAAMESLSPEHRDRIRFENLPPEQRAALEQKARGGAPEMKYFNDFSVARREQLSDDTVKLYLRSSLGTNTASFELKRFGNEWKLMDF